QIAEAEGRVLSKLGTTMLLVTLVMLAAAALSVSTTLASLIMERRKEIGTMKAIGAGPQRLVCLFLFELASLGVGGGIIGYAVGIVLAQAMGRSLFGVGVTPRIQVFGAVLGISLLVALISGIIPVKRMREVQPALILKGD
ncbi:MAG TPA: FtsX-like permease family protein, partial [Blastocatellia bacterium]